MKPPQGILETCLYVADLPVAKRFYTEVMGARVFMEEAERHAFLQIGQSLLFLFEPTASAIPTPPDCGIPVPTHGAHGPGHVAFRVTSQAELDAWQEHLEACGVAIERIIDWPHGARSVYFRDPAGNSLELATADLWQAALEAAD